MDIKGAPEDVWSSRHDHNQNILLVDTFELMTPNHTKLIELMSGLAQRIHIVIASRKKPEQMPSVVLLELPPFDPDTIKDYLTNVGLPAELSGDAFRFSEGNPLLLSFFALAAEKGKNPAEINKDSIASDFVSFIVSEVTGEDVF